jgi:hypothetical protein
MGKNNFLDGRFYPGHPFFYTEQGRGHSPVWSLSYSKSSMGGTQNTPLPCDSLFYFSGSFDWEYRGPVQALSAQKSSSPKSKND